MDVAKTIPSKRFLICFGVSFWLRLGGDRRIDSINFYER